MPAVGFAKDGPVAEDDVGLRSKLPGRLVRQERGEDPPNPAREGSSLVQAGSQDRSGMGERERQRL